MTTTITGADIVLRAVARTMLDRTSDTSVEDTAEVAVRTALRIAGQYLCADIDRRLRDGQTLDAGWMQGVKQAGEDLIRVADRAEGR